MAIRAVTFDFWNTLFREANSAARHDIRISALSKMCMVSEEEAADALKTVWAEFSRCHREEQRTLGPQDAVLLAAEVLGLQIEPPVAETLEKVFATAVIVYSPVPIEGAIEAVQAAAAAIPIGLISDTGVSPGASLQYIMDRHAFTPHFTAITFSDRVGVSKPQPVMFEITAGALGVKPDELLHIGDLEYTDVSGAHGVGAKAALFTAANPVHAHDTRADYVFSNWQEFVDVLPELIR
ncbi:MAG: HAD family hydrolase [Candidatus Hydrogenedentes bacterium]|nr:HAD family hydrolase [Candidatus Hydrogenedentota bacterium]